MAGRQLKVDIIGDSRSLERAFARSETAAKRFHRVMVGTAAAIGVSFGADQVIRGLKSFVDHASDLNEQIGKTEVVFGKSAKSVEAWSKTTTQAFAISETQALATASSFGALFAPIGITGDMAAKQSRKLTELGANLASFYNTDVQTALDAIQSGLVGQSRPLRQYGVQLSEARVQAEAMAETGKKAASSLTLQEKTLARINIILHDTVQAQGDSARSSGRFAFQLKELQAQADDLQGALGEGLLPAITNVTTQFNNWLENPENKTKIITTWTAAIDGLAGAFEGLARAQSARSSTKSKLGPFGFILAGQFETAQLFKQSLQHQQQLVDSLLGTTPAGPATAPPGLAGAVGAVSRPGVPPGLRGPRSGLTEAAGQNALRQFSAVTSFIDKYAALGRRAVSAQKAAARAARAAADYQTRMETRGGWLDFGIERADATKGIADDKAARQKKIRWLQERIRHEGRTLELVSEIWRVRQQIHDLNKKKAKDGDPLAGLMQASTKQLTNMLGAGLGLTGAARGRLAYNIAGAEIVVHTHVHMDGAQVASAVNRHNAKAGRRTAAQTSGRR